MSSHPIRHNGRAGEIHRGLEVPGLRLAIDGFPNSFFFFRGKWPKPLGPRRRSNGNKIVFSLISLMVSWPGARRARLGTMTRASCIAGRKSEPVTATNKPKRILSTSEPCGQVAANRRLRRAKTSSPTQTANSPGSPAPTMGLGTAINCPRISPPVNIVVWMLR